MWGRFEADVLVVAYGATLIPFTGELDTPGVDYLTAIGNVLVQALGLGILGSLADAREVVRRSFDVRTYSPRSPQTWVNSRLAGVLAAFYRNLVPPWTP